jgi:hypothetical protein
MTPKEQHVHAHNDGYQRENVPNDREFCRHQSNLPKPTIPAARRRRIVTVINYHFR